MSVTVPDLSGEQVDAVLNEALHRKFFEADVDGNLPRDPDDRAAAAKELIRQSILSHSVGNKSDGVLSLLHIAEVDLGSPTNHDTGDSAMATAEQDITKLPDAMLTKVLAALQATPAGSNAEEVQQNIKMVEDEIARRNGGTAPAAPVAQPEPAAEMQVTSEVLGPEQTDSFLPQQEAPAAPAIDRTALENQLTFPIMRAHNIDPSEIPSITDSQLQWIIEHPTGNGASPQIADPAPPPAAPAEQQGEEFIQTTRMVRPEPEVATPPPAPISVAAEDAPVELGITAGRVALEEQITGPILKCYGRGRKDVPSIGDAELEFMISHPDGRVTQESLFAARALDEGGSVNPAVFEDNDEVPTIADQNRAEKQEAPPVPAETTPVDGFGPPASAEGPTYTESTSASMEEAVAAAEATPIEAPVTLAPQPQSEVVQQVLPPPKRTLLTDLPENPAQAIIDRENFPIPPELDESPPRLPFDLSKCSDEEIQSYHAQFHACSSRTNFVVGLWESELRDIVKLRKGQEVSVANNLPAKDGRTKITDAQREAMVQADPQVIAYREQEHEVEKVLRQLKVLQSNYSSDVSVCSRQMSMRHKESDGAGSVRA